MPNRGGSERGLTFVELVVAMALLAILSTGLLSAFLSSTTLSEMTYEDVGIENAIRDKQAEILARSTQYDGIDGNVYLGQYTYLDAMIQYYGETTTGESGQLASTWTISAKDSPTGEALEGTILLYLHEAMIPGELGGSLSHELAEEVGGRWYGPMDLDGAPSEYIDLSTPTDGRYAANLVPIELFVEWDTPTGEVSKRKSMMVARTGE
jgi:prepilin-type N-terminal cleavage/methylation domain-containing protein